MVSPDETPPVDAQEALVNPPIFPTPSTLELPGMPEMQNSTVGGQQSLKAPRLPSLRSTSDPASTTVISSSSTPLGMLSNARRPAPGPALPGIRTGGLPQDMQEKMRAFQQSRQGTPPGGRPSISSASTGPPTESPVVGMPTIGGLPGGLRLPNNLRPQAHGFSSAPAVPRAGGKPSLSARRNMKLPGALPKSIDGTPAQDHDTTAPQPAPNGTGGSMFNKFSEFVDTKAGTLKFAGKAVIHSQGIDFSSGNNFSISLDEVDSLEELGKGNYGTVYKVRHARPRIRKPGMGLAGNKLPLPSSSSPDDSTETSPDSRPGAGTTGIIMAMKEIRLELDEAKFAAIIMELDILHRCISPYIIDFYGAFFQEGAVYICIEFMDGGSIDKLYGDGIPERILRKIAYATTIGLKELKDVHNIIHRDVKPTNILVNTRGQIKICDFGVSGNLVASIAKTNIGCQSYMAPERISGGGVAQAGANPGGGTYSVQSDIWSLGLTMIECAMGRYPYPPETYNNIFSQLSAIVNGDPPDLPEEGYSPQARDFVRGCLNKIPKLRPTYAMLLQHGWLAPLSKPATISEDDETMDGQMENLNLDGTAVEQTGKANSFDKEVADWVKGAIERKRSGKMGEAAKPALHAAPLDSVSPVVSPDRIISDGII